jgi:hypothetical protein
MSSMDKLSPGPTAEAEIIVTKENTAERLGSGSVPVFGTPALVGLMEGAAAHLPTQSAGRCQREKPVEATAQNSSLCHSSSPLAMGFSGFSP